MKGSPNDAEPNGRFHEHTDKLNDIFEKVSSMSNISFPAGRGTPIMRDVISANLNNMSASTSLTDAAGLVVLASNDVTKRHWHADVVRG